MSSITSTNRLHFPAKIYLILENESPDIIRWHPNNKAFRITDHTRFEREIIPKYFRHNQMASVQRQLNLYGFKCVSRGEDKGSFYHPKFVRGDWESAKSIRRCITNNQFGNWKLPEDSKLSDQKSFSAEVTLELDSLCDANLMIEKPSQSQTQEMKKEATATTTRPVVNTPARKVDWHWPPAPVIAQQRHVQNLISAFVSNDLTLDLEETNKTNSASTLKIPVANVSKPSYKWHGQFQLDYNNQPLVEKEKDSVNFSFDHNDFNFMNELPLSDLNSFSGADTFDDLMFMCSDLDTFLGECNEQSYTNSFY